MGSVLPYHSLRTHRTCPIPAGTLISAPGLWSQIRAAQISCVWEILEKTGQDPTDFASCLIISCSKHPDLGDDVARQSPSNAASLWRAKCEGRPGGLVLWGEEWLAASLVPPSGAYLFPTHCNRQDLWTEQNTPQRM